jgi:predicted transcriptional regulator
MNDLRELRCEEGLKQHELAALLGVSVDHCAHGIAAVVASLPKYSNE